MPSKPQPNSIEALRKEIRTRQWEQLEALLQTILATNNYYRKRLDGLTLATLEEFFEKCPMLNKKMLVADRELHPPYGSNHTFPLENYTRFCQTSGTTGSPMSWLDSRDDWKAMLDCWQEIYEMAGVEPGEDRIFFPFSFGPFLGFWTAFEAAVRMGCLVIPGGGMSSTARLQMMLNHRCTVACLTPTYALHLGEVRKADLELQQPNWGLRLLIVAGEPGGSVPHIRKKLEALWPGVRIFDHHGLTEIGPVSYEDPAHPGRLVVLEDHYLTEIMDPASGLEVPEGGQGELVLTTLRRLGCPLLRYRTGDLVKKHYREDGALCLEGGVTSRIDDMVCVRGVNVYPSAVDDILARFPDVLEYQVRERRSGAMLELHLAVESKATGAKAASLRRRIESALRDAFALRFPVEVLAPGALPRFEFKARRWIKEVPGGPSDPFPN